MTFLILMLFSKLKKINHLEVAGFQPGFHFFRKRKSEAFARFSRTYFT